jgi:ring-1,2-phenylacetyl-CoA epoxidase subunit PaaD
VTGLLGGPITVAAVRSMVEVIPDPELPVVSIGELGMVHGVQVDDQSIRVTILPTFVGCPALDVIRSSIVAGLQPLGLAVAVEPTFVVPWTSDRISPAGRRALSAAGIAPPTAVEDTCCPLCGSARVVMDSAFGPTQCRALFYCRDCRQPFEAMKLI